MSGPWTKIDQLKADHDRLEKALDDRGWRLLESEDVFYVASRRSAKGWQNRERKIRALKPDLLLERIDELEKEAAKPPAAPMTVPA